MFKEIKAKRAERKAKSEAVFRCAVNIMGVRRKTENDPKLTDELREKVLDEIDLQKEALIEAKIAYDMEPKLMGSMYVVAIVSYILGVLVG